MQEKSDFENCENFETEKIENQKFWRFHTAYKN